MSTTSHRKPLAEVTDGDNCVKVYEEVPGSLTVSFSKSPGMWSGFTMPPEAGSLVIEAIVAAARARDAAPAPGTDPKENAR